jgi:diguanylate cyclase (GGDEF)-like protein
LVVDDRIAVAAGSPGRGERLRATLARRGFEARLLGIDGPEPTAFSAAVVDVADLPDAVAVAERLSARAPALVVGGPGELPVLEEAIAAGAFDLAVDPGDDELAARVRLLLRQDRRRVALRRRETALVELAAASGETIDPTAVLRAILGWLGRALPTADPALIPIPTAGGTPLRVVLPGRGAAAPLSRTDLDQRPELRRALGGDREVRLDLPGGGAALAIGLAQGDELLGVLALRSPVPLGEDALRLAHAAAALATRALAGTRAADEANRAKERVERAYAARFRELLEANRRLRELSHHRQELLAACAHDLRQPLETILADAHALAHRPGDPAAAREIEGAGRRMETLLDDLLDAHAIETGRLELQARPLDAAVLARQAVDALEAPAREAGVPVAFRAPPEGAPIAADPGKLGEAVADLLGATVAASPPGVPVRVEVERTPDEGARISVHADGPGLPEEILAVLRDGAPPPPGEVERGLGLAMVRDIVALHGGRVEAYGRAGTGSTVAAVLPPAPPGATGRAAAEDGVRPRTRPAVLVVEDDPDTLDLLAGLLEDGYEVSTAADGEDGVRVAKAELPDAILLDLYLPRLDGFGALEELRRDPRTAEIPVIFLSAQRDDLVRARGIHLGAADFVVKPFSAAELRARIDRVLQATRKQAHLRALASQDALTGLPNFGAFRVRLEEEVKRARRYRHDLAAVMLDMDNLKPVNDQLGHAAGNRAIVAIADAIRAELRETDFAARYGGDEFVILLPHSDAAHARVLAERLRRAVRRIEVDGGAVPLRASFGVAAVGPGVEGGGEALVRAADAALYRAKRTGRDKVCVAGEAEAAERRGEEAVHGS